MRMLKCWSIHEAAAQARPAGPRGGCPVGVSLWLYMPEPPGGVSRDSSTQQCDAAHRLWPQWSRTFISKNTSEKLGITRAHASFLLGVRSWYEFKGVSFALGCVISLNVWTHVALYSFCNGQKQKVKNKILFSWPMKLIIKSLHGDPYFPWSLWHDICCHEFIFNLNFEAKHNGWLPRPKCELKVTAAVKWAQDI